ncbi:Hypothetical predicted protein [Paramuricea clavata]|uniref:Uncharacterized protein n=1 Tax=Paramuricea clavata TaxID=317549 RepID=A0A6S7HCM9_PARCT|nr:Hypothetical predicted protein [Paramuricea clavata]
MAAFILRQSFCRLGAIASRQKSFATLHNLQNGPPTLPFLRSRCFQKSVFPLVQKNSIHSSCVLQQQTGV